MQFMYLRRKGKSKNPGRHPIGLIGVQKLDCGGVAVGVQMVHSGDRFSKELGRQLLPEKILKDRVALVAKGDGLPPLHTLLPKGVAQRLDNYLIHQDIFEKLLHDELFDGSWSTQAKKSAWAALP